ncbi:uncharacterized protein LOC144167823 [Haemaphysalis longicornis]
MPNPFLFFVQFLLLGISPEAGAQQDAPRLVIAAAKTEDACAHGPTFADNRWWTPPPGRSTSTEQHIRRPSTFYRFSGHVGWPASNMPNPFVFFVQVSNKYSSVKTSNRCLIQLTCPQSVFLACLVIRNFVVSLLMLCGDIESNPGPTVEELLDELLTGQKNIQTRLDAIEAKLKQVEAAASAIKEVNVKVSSLERTVQYLEHKVIDLEDRSRRNNIIVFGIPEDEKETADALANTIVEGVFKNVLGVQLSSIERMHRLERKQANKNRPVILKLFDYREKAEVLANCFKLKGTDISVSEDFSLVTREKRKKLWESTSEIRKAGGKVTMKYDKIKIDDELFEWNDAENKRIPVKKGGGSQENKRIALKKGGGSQVRKK